MSDEQPLGDSATVDTQQNGAATTSPQSATPSSQPADEGTKGGAGNEGNGVGAEKKKEGKKLEELVSLAWKGLLFFGGIVLLIFFVQVGFFPDLKLTDLTATLAAVSLTGLLMLVIFAGSFVVPALMTHASFARLNDAKGVVLMAALAGAVSAWALCLSLFHPSAFWMTVLLYALALVLGVIAYLIHLPTKDEPATAELTGTHSETQIKRGGRFISWCRISVLCVGAWLKRYGGTLLEVLWVAGAFFLGQIIATYYFALTYRSQDSSDQVLMFFAWPFLCFVANIGLLSSNGTDEKRWWKVLGATAGVLLLGFLMMTSASSLMSGGIARRLALGSIPDAVVTLSKQGCEIAEASSRGIMKCRRAKADAPGVVCPVTIVSRIGSEVVLQPKNSNFEVVMKSAEVLGWARTAPPAFASAASGAPSDGSEHGSNGKLLGLHCSDASASEPTSSPAPASSPNPTSAPQPASSSAVALSAVALAEIKTTVQNTITQTMTIHRHSVALRAHARPATNVFYDNHGEVTVNNLGTARGADDDLHISACEERGCAPGDACAAKSTTTIDTLATRASVSTSATLPAADGVSR
ncbi:hypothetical protein [Paraburkholderia youngii]|uniref:hypothetical protein n=1 Tax=Paraburkholderia youngii TaxID=2782701 RepID=UPI003D23DAC9